MTDNEKLAKIIALGKKRYIVRYGVIGWGLGTAMAFTAWNYYTKHMLRPLEIIIPLIAFPLSGIAWGAFMWSVTKRRYDKSVAGDLT